MLLNVAENDYVSKSELIKHLRFLFGSDSKVTQIYKEINNFKGVNKFNK